MCFWLYTSGTTGRPKGTVHVHADLKLTYDLYARPILGLTDRDVCYSVAKLFFAYGLGNALTFPLALARPRSCCRTVLRRMRWRHSSGRIP